MQFDEVARRVVEERLAAGTDGHRLADLDVEMTQLGHDAVEVVHPQCHVLAPIIRWRSLDEVDLLRTDVEPGTSEPEVGPVGARRESEHVDVERKRSGDVRSR